MLDKRSEDQIQRAYDRQKKGRTKGLWIYYIILRDLIKIDEIVLQQCDVEMYLETMRYGVSYGKKLKFRGFQKLLFCCCSKGYQRH